MRCCPAAGKLFLLRMCFDGGEERIFHDRLTHLVRIRSLACFLGSFESTFSTMQI